MGECGSTLIYHGEGEDVEKPPEVEVVVSGGGRYLFRGDDRYRGGSIGRALGCEADKADIQSFADHVLRKQSHLSSRYTSFTTETKVARRFTSGADNRYVIKVELSKLRDLQAQRSLRIWNPDLVSESLRGAPKKVARQAADVEAAMRRNRETLIEGLIFFSSSILSYFFMRRNREILIERQIPAELIEPVIP
jgi:hypothetical protein